MTTVVVCRPEVAVVIVVVCGGFVGAVVTVGAVEDLLHRQSRALRLGCVVLEPVGPSPVLTLFIRPRSGCFKCLLLDINK